MSHGNGGIVVCSDSVEIDRNMADDDMLVAAFIGPMRRRWYANLL